jgi:hypothetical protein
LDENQWLKDIQQELLQALKRLGINPPSELKNTSSSPSNEMLRDRIDTLAEVLMECALNHRTDEKEKITLLKLYYEE